MRKILCLAGIVPALLLGGYILVIAWQIHEQSTVDEAQPADVI